MKIFISWSGDLSRQVAELFKNWVEDVLQGTESWISTDDIDKGSLWFGDITSKLAQTSVGVLFLTRENIAAPWVLFEAGALSKGLTTSRVCPVLVDLSISELKPPLSSFNATTPSKAEMLKLLTVINNENKALVLPEDKFKRSFERSWLEFESEFKQILERRAPAPAVHKKSVPEVLDEILEETRSIQRMLINEHARGLDTEAKLLAEVRDGNVPGRRGPVGRMVDRERMLRNVMAKAGKPANPEWMDENLWREYIKEQTRSVSGLDKTKGGPAAPEPQ